MHQKHFAHKLNKLQVIDYFIAFQSLHHQLAWFTHSRSDLCAHANILSQVTANSFAKKHIKIISTSIRQIKESKLGLTQHRLNRHSMPMVFLILLTDSTNRANWLYFISYNSKIIVYSVLGGEMYSFEDIFHFAYTLPNYLVQIVGLRVLITMLTGSEILFRVIIKFATTSERRLFNYIIASREAYKLGDMDDLDALLQKTMLQIALQT